MPSIFSKFALKAAGSLPPEWILFYMRMTKAQKLAILGAIVGVVSLLRQLYIKSKIKKPKSNGKIDGRKKSLGVNLEFLKQMKFLLRIMVPNLWSKQIAILLAHTATLVARTFLSIYVAKLEGTIVKEIVQR
jgi:hypothetical protein